MAVALDCKLPLLDFTLLGSAEGNEFRIDRGETRRGQVSGLPRIITSGKGEEGGQLPASLLHWESIKVRQTCSDYTQAHKLSAGLRADWRLTRCLT